MGVFLNQWQTAKRNFENALQGRKKPSEKFLGIFRKSSGLEAGCKGLDQCVQKFDVKAMHKAVDAFDAAKEAYLRTLDRAGDNPDDNYKQQIATLRVALGQLVKDFQDAWQAMAEQEFGKLAKSMTESQKSLLKSYQQFVTKLDKAEGQLQEADAAWRDVAAAVTANDKKAAKQAVAVLKDKVKVLLAATSELSKGCQQKLREIENVVESWDKHEDVIAVDTERYNKLRMEVVGLGTSVQLRTERIAEIVQEAKELLTNAARTMEQGLDDAEEVYRASIGKFVQRAADACTSCTKDVGHLKVDLGKIEQGYQGYQQLAGGEPKEKKKALLLDLVNRQLKTAQQLGLRIDNARKALKKEWKSFPEYYRKLVGNDVQGDVNTVFSELDEATADAANVTTKYRELQTGLSG
ncbi:MAG: hypothetical protein JNM56_35275 [Planctomycetia bacterium]|nr:hypothetical protein [Planctomycetia bacterium]